MSRTPHPAFARDRPLVYAHRGGAGLRPENTIAAFDNGLAAGADGLELDVHLSRDGEVVVHHDRTLDRTTHASGPLKDRTADELARVDAGYAFRSAGAATEYPFRGQGHAVPRLRDVLARYPGVPMIIELKAHDHALPRLVIDLLREAGAIDRVTLGSFNWGVLNLARHYEPRIPTGASREETRWALYRSWVGWPLGTPAYAEIQAPERAGGTRVISPRFIAHARRAGVAVKAWTVDDPSDMRRLMRWGVVGIITDRPDVAARVVRECARAAGG